MTTKIRTSASFIVMYSVFLYSSCMYTYFHLLRLTPTPCHVLKASFCVVINKSTIQAELNALAKNQFRGGTVYLFFINVLMWSIFHT